MAAFGPKRTIRFAMHPSAFDGKAGMTIAGIRFRGRYKAPTPFCSANIRLRPQAHKRLVRPIFFPV
jgi:hypothetical protein